MLEDRGQRAARGDNHDQQVDQHDGADDAEREAAERGVHGGDLSAQGHRRALRRILGGVLNELVDIAGHGPEVAALGGGVELVEIYDAVA